MLHGLYLKSDHRAGRCWEKFSRKQRKALAKMGAPIGGEKNIEPDEERMHWLDRLHPDKSYSAPERVAVIRQMAESSGQVDPESAA